MVVLSDDNGKIVVLVLEGMVGTLTEMMDFVVVGVMELGKKAKMTDIAVTKNIVNLKIDRSKDRQAGRIYKDVGLDKPMCCHNEQAPHLRAFAEQKFNSHRRRICSHSHPKPSNDR